MSQSETETRMVHVCCELGKTKSRDGNLNPALISKWIGESTHKIQLELLSGPMRGSTENAGKKSLKANVGSGADLAQRLDLEIYKMKFCCSQ